MIWHVVPIDDVMKHTTETSLCECNPTLEEQPSGDFILVHNSYDGRELAEMVPPKGE